MLGYALAIAGALLAGVAAFWLAQIAARRLQSRRPSELLLLAFYVEVFLGIALAAFGFLIWQCLPHHNAAVILTTAVSAWLVLAVLLWRVRKLHICT